MYYSREYSALYRVAEENLIQLAERRGFVWLLLVVLTASLLLFSSLILKKKKVYLLILLGAGKLNWRLEVPQEKH